MQMIDILDMSNKEILKEMGKRLGQKRINRRLTQQELADHAGVNVATVAGMEAGKNISIDTFISILRSFNELQIIYQLFLESEELLPSILVKAWKKQEKLTKLRVRKPKSVIK